MLGNSRDSKAANTEPVTGALAAVDKNTRTHVHPHCIGCLFLFVGFGNLKSLVKLQASFNPFTHLPDDMWQLPQLEMFRLAVGHLDKWPADLTQTGTPAINRSCCLPSPTDACHFRGSLQLLLFYCVFQSQNLSFTAILRLRLVMLQVVSPSLHGVPLAATLQQHQCQTYLLHFHVLLLVSWLWERSLAREPQEKSSEVGSQALTTATHFLIQCSSARCAAYCLLMVAGPVNQWRMYKEVTSCSALELAAGACCCRHISRQRCCYQDLCS